MSELLQTNNNVIDVVSQSREELSKAVVGQAGLIDSLLMCILADGHLLVEGPPGVAKTRAIRELGKQIHAKFHRIQFTPDLLPADITGTDVYAADKGEFKFQAGPLFNELILADEINRAPAKVQSALLEAMAERQISVGNSSYDLPELFLVMATQNPLEQEGTYTLPEAQLDRFTQKVLVGYPDAQAELEVLQINRREIMTKATAGSSGSQPKLDAKTLFAARAEVMQVHLSEAIERYLVQIIMATRVPEKIDPQLAQWIRFGASPRGSIALERSARALAWMDGKDFVSPEDIRTCVHLCLRHRIGLTFEAESENVNSDVVLTKLLDKIPLP